MDMRLDSRKITSASQLERELKRSMKRRATELTGSGSGVVQRELERLTSSELVNVTLIGKRKHYQADPVSPVSEELRGLALKTVAMVQPIRQALGPLADRVSLALVCGSVAKGTHTASDDIDLLLVADHLTLEDIYSALIPVEADLGRTINPTFRRPLAMSKKAAMIRLSFRSPRQTTST